MLSHARAPVHPDHRRDPSGSGRWSRLGLLLAIPLLGSCDFVAGIFTSPPTSEHAEYARGLVDAGLAATPLARAWAGASDRALEQPEQVTLPVRREGWFSADSPSALAVRFAAPAERWVTVRARLAGTEATRLFVDAYRLAREAGTPPVVLASSGDSAVVVSFRARRNGEMVVRIQPELLRGGAWELEVTASDEEPRESEAVALESGR